MRGWVKHKCYLFDCMIEPLNVLTTGLLGPQMKRGSGALIILKIFAVAA